MRNKVQESEIKVQAGEVELEGNLLIPKGARGIVVFAHGSGSSRFSSRMFEEPGKLSEVARLTRDWVQTYLD